MRAAVLALLVLAMAGPQRLSTSEGAAKPVALDASMSITPEMRAWEADLVRDQLKLKPSDPAVIFAKQPIAHTVGDALASLTGPSGCQLCGPQATNLAAALQKLTALNEAGGPVVLVTDGWENQGDAAQEVAGLLAAHAELYIFTPPGAAAIHNVAVSEVSTPHALANTDSFRVGVTLANLNDHPVAGTVRLLESGKLIEQRKLTLNPGSVRVDFPVRSAGTGLTSYRATFTASNPADDLYPQDDSLQSWVGIGAKRKMLISPAAPRTPITCRQWAAGWDWSPKWCRRATPGSTPICTASTRSCSTTCRASGCPPRPRTRWLDTSPAAARWRWSEAIGVSAWADGTAADWKASCR